MTPQDLAEEYRSYLAINIHTAPTNSKLVVHSTMEYFLDVMGAQDALKVTCFEDDNSLVVKSEW